MARNNRYMKGIMFFVTAVLLIAVVVSVSVVNVQARPKWKKLYADFIAKDQWCQNYATSAKFLYINNDKIPEIYIQGRDAASGNALLTIYKGKVYFENLDGHGGLDYVEKKGIVYLYGGHMDSYYDSIGKLVKGKVVIKNGGYFGAEDNSNVKVDANNNPIYDYYWENKKVSEKKYKAKVKKAKGNYKYKSIYNNGTALSMKKLKKKLR